MKFTEVKAVGDWVVIKAQRVIVKEKKTDSGIIIPGGKNSSGTDINTKDGKETSRLFIYDIGPEVKNKNFKVGDEVIVDNYDIQAFGDDEDLYCVVGSSKIKCVISTKD